MFWCGAGGFPGSAEFMLPGEQWSQEASDSSRRFSVDASGGGGLPLHLQGTAPCCKGIRQDVMALLCTLHIHVSPAVHCVALWLMP